MQDEQLTLYRKDALDQPIACARKTYYDADFTTYEAYYPALVDVILFNLHGEALLQKRARNKRTRPGLLHTSVGGHVSWGETPTFAVTHECMEELGAPAFVYPKDGYAAAYAKLGPYSRKAALVCEVDDVFRDYRHDAIEGRRDIKDRAWFYLGRYDGPVESLDRASSGYEWISMETLQDEFVKHPEQFTVGLKLYVEVYAAQIREFIRTYCALAA